MTPDRQEANEAHGGPRLIVPLNMSEREVDLAVDKLLASGVHTPDDLLDRAVITRRDAYYVPVFVFEGSYEATWTASFGYDRTEHYTDYQNRTENGETRRVPVTRQRVVTDWHPMHGNDAGDFTVTAYAGARLASKAVELVESGAVFGRTQAYQPSLTSGLHVEAPLGENDVYTGRAQPKVNAQIDRSVKAHGQGSSQSDWHWTARITERTATHALLPIRHVVYEYEGKTYNVWFDGAYPFRHVADSLPQDQQRRQHVKLGYVPAAAVSVQLFFAGLLGEPSGPLGAVSWSTAAIVAGAWTFSAVRAFLIQSDSHIRRQTRLAQRRAARGTRPAASDRPRRWWPTNRLVDGALVALATILFWTIQSHAVDADREAQLTAARLAAQAQAAEQERDRLALAVREVESYFTSRSQFAGTAIYSMLVAAARNGWTEVDALAHDKVAPAAVSPAGRQAALDAIAAGLAALKKDRDAAAIAAFARAAKADPGNAQAHAYLAAAELKAGDAIHASDAVDQALRLAPDNATAWFVQSILWMSSQEALARQGLRLTLHFSDDRKQTMADLHALQAEFTSYDTSRGRAVVADVLNAAAAIP
jgi:tetratricopeptide (TPR) repeat protein